MRRLLMLVCLAAVGLLVPAAPAQAATTTETFPFEGTFEVCGETLELSGSVLAVITVQPQKGGEGFLVTFHFNPQGVSGTSDSGARYQGTGVTTETFVAEPSGGFTDTIVNRFHLVGTGGAPTYSVMETVHFTLTPSGDLATDVFNFSIECM